jgi:2-polyprenyl-3-methyl-5-hydroxy-6-metoxy-1,4-benzoquinol methylase
MMVDTRQEQTQRFFSAFAETWDSLYGRKRNLAWRLLDYWLRRDVQQRYAVTFERLGHDLRGQAVLDIGCGSGIYSFEAARRGAPRVVGIDLAEGMVSLAKRESARLGFDNTCQFIAGSFPPDDLVAARLGQFDYGIVMGVMDYVSDPLPLLSALRPMIKKLAVISFPGRHWLRAPLRSYRYKLMGRCEVYTYNEAEVRAALSAASFNRFEILTINHSGGCYIVTAHTG